MRLLSAFLFILILKLLIHKSDSLFKLTNIKCTSYDKAFCDFTRCELKVLGRGKIGLFLYAKVHQLPVKQVLINLNLFRWFNGYRPFMYNVTVDFCNYMRHPKRFPWFNILYETMVQFSNLNHSCPYNHDIIVSNMTLRDEMLRRAPFPTGAYMVQVTVGNPAWKGVAQVMLEIVENDLQKPLKNQTNKRS